MNDPSVERLAAQILNSYRPDDDSQLYVDLADQAERMGQPYLEVSAIDRAWALAPDPSKDAIDSRRQGLLDALAVEAYGISFRYIPGGSFLMGSDEGEPDEAPVHPVRLNHYWISNTPVTWTQYCAILGWEAPPVGVPSEDRINDDNKSKFMLVFHGNKIRLQYCESETTQAIGWHAHQPAQELSDGRTIQDVFGKVPRESDLPFDYNEKPMVAVAWQDGEHLGQQMSDPETKFRLPIEAEWEKAARGGQIATNYSWGNESPTCECCDFGSFEGFRMRKPRVYPPNGYGIYGMCGGVSEWTRSRYDAKAYHDYSKLYRPETHPHEANRELPLPDLTSEETHVLRGGSWADCAAAVTVSFRMARSSLGWIQEGYGSGATTPNVGFRLVREISKEMIESP